MIMKFFKSIFKKKTETDKFIAFFIKRCKAHENIDLAMLEALVRFRGSEVVSIVNIESLLAMLEALVRFRGGEVVSIVNIESLYRKILKGDDNNGKNS